VSQTTKIVFCQCAWADVIDARAKEAVRTGLIEAGVAFEAVPDLCGLAARRDERLAMWTQAPDLRIVACFPRAVRWLFDWAAAPLPASARVLNLRTTAPDDVLADLLEGDPPRGPHTGSIQRESDWMPWFPVIDYERCADCRQCLNFCLFGVYASDETGRVKVVNPSGCKTYCPACARVCPERAIIFPKYDKSPINGDAVDEAALAQVRGSGLLDGLDAGELRRRLRARSGTGRFPMTATSGPSPLEALAEKLDIPPQVLQNLSPEEKRRLGHRAGEKGKAGADDPPEGLARA
jgi:Pyruvate/2-oxoacid:ferredoxin oxidoreductase delta subunit